MHYISFRSQTMWYIHNRYKNSFIFYGNISNIEYPSKENRLFFLIMWYGRKGRECNWNSKEEENEWWRKMKYGINN